MGAPERQRDAPKQRPSFRPVGLRGLDLWTARGAMHPDSLVASSNVRYDRRDARRRDGMQVVQVLPNLQDATGALVVADATDYAYAPWHAAQEFDVGPWAIPFHFKAVRPGANPANHAGVTIMLREVADGSHKSSYGLELKADGTFLAHFTRNSDSVKTTCSTVLANNLVVDGFLFWDPYTAGGTLSLVVNDAVVSTQTGIGATAIPLRSASARLMWGQTSLGAVPADLEADTCFAAGVIDAITGLTWPGRDPSVARDNGRSLFANVRRFARQSWPNPLEAAFHYDFDGDGKDWSYSANHATVVGSPAYQGRLAYPLNYGQHVGVYDKTNGSRELVVFSGGRIFTQPLKAVK